MILVTFLRGATALGCAIVALVFARFWVTTLDRLFLWFALAFAILAVDYTVLGLLPAATEWQLSVFVIRLFAFCLILVGIVAKNRD
jgi:hypothetical protein